jgi:hypothetical protein
MCNALIPSSFPHPNRVQIEVGPWWSGRWFPNKRQYNGQLSVIPPLWVHPSSWGTSTSHLDLSEVQNKMIIMGHQILSCHVLVVRSFLSCNRCCYQLEIFHMITSLNILILSSIIPKSDLVLSHNSSCDVPISTFPVPKSHILVSHNSSCYNPNIIFSCPKKTHHYVA